jgi:hypothetical protein
MTATEKQKLVEELLASLNTAKNKVRLVQDESPMGIDVQGDYGGQHTTIQVAPAHDGTFRIKGVRSFNAPDKIEIVRITSGADLPRNAGPFDSATYFIDHVPKADRDLAEHRGYYEVPWGEISKHRPLVISFRVKGCPSVLPSLSWTLYGIDTVVHDDGQVTHEAMSVAEPEPEPEDQKRGTPPGALARNIRAAQLAQKERERARANYPELAHEDQPSPPPWGILRR